MLIEDILLNKSKNLVTIQPDATVSDAVNVLADNNIGALPVCEAEKRLVGIISERDIVRLLSERGNDVLGAKVAEVMTSEVFTCTPADDVNDVMGLMKSKRVRHFPVVEDGRLSEMISSRDAMFAMLEESFEHRRTLATAYELVR
ncbi:MAG: CBS domain-containing protein [Rhodospirillaceae bacterium]|nr:CBS domain-containing protein [Rhodospirillaceae bacterium]